MRRARCSSSQGSNRPRSTSRSTSTPSRWARQTEFEVELKIEGRAELPANFLFSFDLLYAGVFRIQNVPQDSVHALVMIECPRLLFPFARAIIADAVRNGGFPPLMIDPVDFVSLYRQRMAEQQPPAAPPPG